MKIYHVNSKHSKVGIAMLILDRVMLPGEKGDTS